MFFIGLYLCLKFLALRILEVGSYLFCVLKIHEEILSRRNSEKLSEMFFDEVYPPKFYLTKFFVANVEAGSTPKIKTSGLLSEHREESRRSRGAGDGSHMEPASELIKSTIHPLTSQQKMAKFTSLNIKMQINGVLLS